MWILKDPNAYENPNDGEPAEYLHDWKVGPLGRPHSEVWLPDQSLAHRFADRNEASKMATSVCRDEVRVVKLVAKRADSQRARRDLPRPEIVGDGDEVLDEVPVDSKMRPGLEWPVR